MVMGMMVVMVVAMTMMVVMMVDSTSSSSLVLHHMIWVVARVHLGRDQRTSTHQVGGVGRRSLVAIPTLSRSHRG